MGERLNISGGVKFQAPIQETNNVDEAKPQEVKEEAPSAPPKEGPRSADTSSRKLEQSFNGTVLKADLNKQLDYKLFLDSESLKAADKILTNPRLSNEAKIAELQKTIGKTDKAEFRNFMKNYSKFPADQQQLINSAITESEKIMGRIGMELPQDEQLKVVQEAVMNPLKGKTPKEEQKRLERFDKGVEGWMRSTDIDTLDKALDGRSINIKASAKLYGTLVANASGLIFGMGGQQGKIMGDKLEIATAVMNAAHDQQAPASREDQEAYAASLIMRNIEREERGRANRLGRERE